MNTSVLKFLLVMAVALVIVMWLSSLNVFAGEVGHVSGWLRSL
jgi:hypothetical protein